MTLRRLYLITIIAFMLLGCGGNEGGTERDTTTTDVGVADGTGASDQLAPPDTTSAVDTVGSPLAPPTGVTTPLPWSTEATNATCADDIDNDGNTFKDCSDFGCSRNLAVFVCGTQHHYEASPELCSDGKDNDGDGLVDCDDPDCFKNPFHDTCPKTKPESDCRDGIDNDNDGHTDCDDFDCKILDPACRTAMTVRVLFDQTVDETAVYGPNSDWIVDASGWLPSPSNPTSADQWHGALSSFGYALHQKGMLVESLVPWQNGRLSYQDPSNPQDLSNYDVLVMVEPSMGMSAEQKSAIIRYVLDGGSLLMVANHLGADRDGNNWAAPQVWNDMLFNNTEQNDPFGIKFDEIDADPGDTLTNVKGPHPVLEGANGTVTKIGFYKGCTAQLTGTNAKAQGLIFLDDATDAQTKIIVAVAEAGKGRVVAITDSAIATDASDSHGTVSAFKETWGNPQQHNAALFLNAIDWLLAR